MREKSVDRPAAGNLSEKTMLQVLFAGTERQLICTGRDQRMRAVEACGVPVVTPVLRNQDRRIHRDIVRKRVRELRREPVGKPFPDRSLKRMVDVRAERVDHVCRTGNAVLKQRLAGSTAAELTIVYIYLSIGMYGVGPHIAGLQRPPSSELFLHG